MIRGASKQFKGAATRISFLSHRHSAMQLNLVVERLNSSRLRAPSKERGMDGFYAWGEVDGGETRTELQRLVSSWIGCDRNFALLLKSEPHLREICAGGRAMLLPDREGHVQFAFIPRLLDDIGPARNAALHLFTNLLVNPLAEKLSGPCEHCRLFFISKRDGGRVYCSRKCSSAATSKKTRDERRSRERFEKLGVAQLSVNRSMKRGSKDWKEDVSSETRISKKWLTQAANAGELHSLPSDPRSRSK